MRKVILALSFAALFLMATVLPPGVSAHRYHTSVTRLEYNADEQIVEITVQTFSDDIEAALEKRSKTSGNVHLDRSKASNALVLDYLRSVIEIKTGDAPMELQWIGLELKGYTAWIYLQAKAPSGLAQASVRNRLLFELFADQVNIINLINNGKRTSLVFNRDDGAKAIP